MYKRQDTDREIIQRGKARRNRRKKDYRAEEEAEGPQMNALQVVKLLGLDSYLDCVSETVKTL